MNKPDSLSDNEVAFAALQLFGNTPVGAEPDWQEIYDWHMQILDESRAEQVLSHVANNPDCFQQWQDICEAEQYVELTAAESLATDEHAQVQKVAEPGSTYTGSATNTQTNEQAAPHKRPAAWDLVGWLRHGAKAVAGKPMPALGGAVAATVLAVLIVPKLLTPTPANVNEMLQNSFEQYRALGAPLPSTAPATLTTRSMAGVLGDMANEDVEIHQIAFGYRTAFSTLHGTDNVQWRPWFESLPEKAIDCALASDTDRCAASQNEFEQLGQWGLLNMLACESASSMSNTFWTEQATLYVALRSRDSVAQSSIVTHLPNTTANNDAAGVCNAATALTTQVSE